MPFLVYLLHAYDYCPDDPMVNLCLAVASMGRAMQRQADNRHHLIAQAMAFLTRYRELRSRDPNGLQEIEFNFGRAFQTLGTLLITHYTRVHGTDLGVKASTRMRSSITNGRSSLRKLGHEQILRSVTRYAFVFIDSKSFQDVGLAKEAAYNLSIIYVTTGATSLAEALYRRWLSI